MDVCVGGEEWMCVWVVRGVDVCVGDEGSGCEAGGCVCGCV